MLEIELDNLPQIQFDLKPEQVRWHPQYALARLPEGLIALDLICPFREMFVLVRWSEEHKRFYCPACGSRYELDGTYILGPAPRGLDRRVLHVTTPDGTISTPADGSPIPIEGATRILLDVQEEILGQSRPAALSRTNF